MEYENSQLQKSNAGQGMGIAALVLGILGVLTAFIPCFGLFAILFGILAIIFGIIGYSQAKKQNASLGLPLTGLILGILATLFVVIWTFIFATAIASSALDLNAISKEIQINSQDTLNEYPLDQDTLDQYGTDQDTIFSQE